MSIRNPASSDALNRLPKGRDTQGMSLSESLHFLAWSVEVQVAG